MKLTFAILLIVLLFALFFLIIPKSPPKTALILSPTPTITPQQMVLGTIHSSSQSKCKSNGILPDPTCTPGAIDQSVTQQNLYQTICVKGYTTKVRPPVSYTNKLKIQQISDYGFSDTNPRDYEEDHLISLELGGSPKDPANLWPEPGASPNPKDKIENICHEKVCNGVLLLSVAQHQIATDWQKACQ